MRRVQYIRYGGPSVLSLSDWPEPSPEPGEVAIEMQTASVNPVDGKLRAGAMQAVTGPIEGPTGCGRDGAGRIRAVGPDVDPTLIGKAVCLLAPFTAPTWAEIVIAPAEIVAQVPAGVSIQQAAALPLAGICAWRALVDVAQVQPGERVLIHAAAGGVGHLAVQLARYLGAEVTGTCSAANRDFVKRLGADHVVAYDQEDVTAAAKDMDVIYDLVGGVVHTQSAGLLRSGGRLVYLNTGPLETPDMPADTKRLNVVIEPDVNALTKMLDLIALGHIVPDITALPLTEFAQAHTLIDSGHVRGKIVLDIG